MDGNVNRQILAGYCSRYRVDEKRHVIVDQFDKREVRRITVLAFARIEDAQQCLAFLARSAKLEMVERDSGHGPCRSAQQVLDRHIDKVIPQISLDLGTVCECFGLFSSGYNSVKDALSGVAIPA